MSMSMPMPMQNLPCAHCLSALASSWQTTKKYTLDGSGTSRGFPQAILRQFDHPPYRIHAVGVKVHYTVGYVR